MKKHFYIAAFGLLGFLLATVIHGVVEIVALDLIFGNPENSHTVYWQKWETIHGVAGNALWLVGIVLGLSAGVRWWDQYGSKPGAFGWGR